MSTPHPTYVEVGKKRVFACAIEWPGWCRSGKTEEAALEALAAYAPRYALVADQARISFKIKTAASFSVVERIPGTMTTDFGAPDAIVKADLAPLNRKDAERLASLLESSWTVFDRVVAKAHSSLRKGPRGGGRDRDQVAEHVVNTEDMYARKIGLRIPDVRLRRLAILDAIRGVHLELPEKGWPVRYAVRRLAWHVLDHAWEIEDRSE